VPRRGHETLRFTSKGLHLGIQPALKKEKSREKGSTMWSLDYLMGNWRPEIGDPHYMGWFTVGSYFACALVISCAAWQSRGVDRRASAFWFGLTLLMIFLGINKQLDLQTLLTEMGRQIAKAQGWMENRRAVQACFILAFGSGVVMLYAYLMKRMKDELRRYSFAMTGLFFLLSFIMIRAASFHHFDRLIDWTIFGARMNWILELSGIFLIMLAGFEDIIRRMAVRD
jgi:hypothetical protein